MQCIKTGYGADFGNGHMYAGDKFGCLTCKTEVIVTNKTAYHDAQHALRVPGEDSLRMSHYGC